MDVLLVVVTGIMCILCFWTGVRTGQQVSRGERAGIPLVNPVKVFREHVEHGELEADVQRMDVIMRNIEAYDGTANNQEDVPRG